MKPRLLLIGHTYAALENRKKIQALAAHFELVCVTSEIESRVILGRPASDFDNDSDAPGRAYELVRLPRTCVKDTAFAYPGLGVVMRRMKFDVILVENEPWAVICWQARLLAGWLQSSARFVVFTWENLVRPGVKGRILSVIYRASTLTTDGYIAGNKRAAEILVKHGAGKEKVLVAPQLGVDLANHHPVGEREKMRLRVVNGLPPDAFIAGYCGRLTEEKGMDELLRAGETLAGEGMHLALLGAGVMRERLEQLPARHEWMHLLPPRPHFDIPDFLRCLDVFVLASKPLINRDNCWEEQFGHVLIEAMACGVATLGSSSGAIPEVLGDERAVFEWGNAEALTKRLRVMKNDAALRTELARAQRGRVERHYTHDAVAEHWARFLTGLHAGKEMMP
ncbi:MAG TPA: hypothetical protein DIT64_06825 [Verrucomicrobiales bacterium]|nr:hypothetical protein [Verrucomicrobiales bacterium]